MAPPVSSTTSTYPTRQVPSVTSTALPLDGRVYSAATHDLFRMPQGGFLPTPPFTLRGPISGAPAAGAGGATPVSSMGESTKDPELAMAITNFNRKFISEYLSGREATDILQRTGFPMDRFRSDIFPRGVQVKQIVTFENNTEGTIASAVTGFASRGGTFGPAPIILNRPHICLVVKKEEGPDRRPVVTILAMAGVYGRDALPKAPPAAS